MKLSDAFNCVNQYIKKHWLLLFFVLLISMALHFFLFPYSSGDMEFELLNWFNAFEEMSFFEYFGSDVSSRPYTDPYNVLLFIAKSGQQFMEFHFGVLNPDKFAIKMITIPFELIAAYSAMVIVHYFKQGDCEKFLAFSLIIIHPIILLNGAFWGQCDIIYASLVLVSFMLILYEKWMFAVIFFAIAVSNKFPAMFFAPFLFSYVLQNRIRWCYLVSIPVVYTVLNLPSLIAGKSMMVVYMLYGSQASTVGVESLSRNAPNLYQIFSNDMSRILVGIFQYPITLLVALIGMYFAVNVARNNLINQKNQLFFASLSAMLFPYFLPSMAERYFFLAEIFLILLVIIDPKFWYLPIIVSTASLLSYYNYYCMIDHKLMMNDWPSKVGAIFNTIALLLLTVQWYMTNQTTSEKPYLSLAANR